MYSFDLDGRRLSFHTAPGVFSADRPDEGSVLLLKTLLPRLRPHQRVLDLGTGAGFLGICMSSRLARGEIWMVDSDVRAIRVSKRNVEENAVTNAHVLLGDGARDLPAKLRFDVIATNPPTHDGRAVLDQFVEESFCHLKPGGSMWVVVNRLLSVRKIMECRFGEAHVESRSKGFLVLRAERSRNRS